MTAMEREVFVRHGVPSNVVGSGLEDAETHGDWLVLAGGLQKPHPNVPEWKVRGFGCFGWGNTFEAGVAVARDEFRLHARLRLPELAGDGASLIMGGGYHTPFAIPEGRHACRVWLDGTEAKVYVLDYDASRKASGNWPTRPYTRKVITEKYERIRTAGRRAVGVIGEHIEPGKPFDLEWSHRDGVFVLAIDGREVFRSKLSVKRWPLNIGFLADRGPLHIQDFWVEGRFVRPVFEEVDVWHIGAHGYNTYRIPALCAAPDGTLLAFAEARRPGPNRGEVDCVLKYSTDGGDNWSAQKMVWDPGDERFFARDPSPVVDRHTGHIFLLVGSNAPPPGETEPGKRRLFLMSSGDNGATWSDARPLQLIRDDMDFLTGGPCHGIQLTRSPFRGRLVVPCYAGIGGSMRSCMVFSDDHGASWQLGGVAATKTNESTVVELQDGTVLMNCRDSGAVYLSKDGGETVQLADWKISGRTVDATLLRQDLHGELDSKKAGRILFCCPADGGGHRRGLTVRVSHDEGRTWPGHHQLYAGGAAYSDMTVLPDGRVGVIYEKDDYRRVSFVAVDIEAFGE